MGTRVQAAVKGGSSLSLTAPWGGDLALASGTASPALGHFVPCHRRLFHIWGQDLEAIGTARTAFPCMQPLLCASWWEGWDQGQSIEGEEVWGACAGSGSSWERGLSGDAHCLEAIQTLLWEAC